MPSIRRKARDFSLPLRIEQLVKRTQIDGVAMVIKTSRLLLTAALFGFSAPAFAQEQFGTPEAAVEALVAAARSGDGDAILKVLGPDGKPIVSSGDPVADSNIRQDFVSPMMPSTPSRWRATARRPLSLATTIGLSRFRSSTKRGQWQFDTNGRTR